MKRNKNEKIVQSVILNYFYAVLSLIFVISIICYLLSKETTILSICVIFNCILFVFYFCIPHIRKSDNIFINQKENYIRINDKKIKLDEIELVKNKLNNIQLNNTYCIMTKNNEDITINFPLWNINKIILNLGLNDIKVIHSDKILIKKTNINLSRILNRVIFIPLFFIFIILTFATNQLDDLIFYSLVSIITSIFLFIEFKSPYTKFIYDTKNKIIKTKDKIIPFYDFSHYEIKKAKFNSYKYIFYTKNNETIEHYQPFYEFNYFEIFYLILMMNITQNPKI